MMPNVRRPRLMALLGLVLALAACADGRELGERRAELGNFRLGHNIVIDSAAVQGPLSRRVDPGAWQAALQSEVARRFGRYEGDRLYHLALHVDAYVLAIPGIPLVASPRSALIVGVHVWDDALGRPLNDERRQFTVLESLSGESLVGSGLTQSAEQQMTNLSRNAVVLIERWMAEHPEWFSGTAAPAAEGAAAAAPAAAPAAPAPAPAPAAPPAPAPVPAPTPVAAAPEPVAEAEPPVPEAELLPRRPVPVAEAQPGPG